MYNKLLYVIKNKRNTKKTNESLFALISLLKKKQLKSLTDIYSALYLLEILDKSRPN